MGWFAHPLLSVLGWGTSRAHHERRHSCAQVSAAIRKASCMFSAALGAGGNNFLQMKKSLNCKSAGWESALGTAPRICPVLTLILVLVRDRKDTWTLDLTLHGYSDVLTSLVFSFRRRAEKCHKESLSSVQLSGTSPVTKDCAYLGLGNRI